MNDREIYNNLLALSYLDIEMESHNLSSITNIYQRNHSLLVFLLIY